jgi:pyridoxal phosphate enzyme (YggS family)
MEAGNEAVFKERYHKVRERITRASCRAGRDPAGVKLIAATKGIPVEALREAAGQKCTVFGENRVQEALAKMDALREEEQLEWHLIGPLQSNKVASAVGRFSLIHSIDRLEVAERLDRLARERGVVQPILLEVNIAGERTKHGFEPGDLIAVAERMGHLTGLQLIGLMAIPPAGLPEEARPHFRLLRELALRIERRGIAGVRMRELSMGMSADFETAIEEGATMVRIGAALFGPRSISQGRPYRPPVETIRGEA